MIVKETRTIFELDDIQRIIIRCLHCRGELSVKNRRIGPDLRTKVIRAEACPHCGHHGWRKIKIVNGMRKQKPIAGRL